MADVPAAAAAAAALPGITSWQRLATSATPTLIACILASVGALLAHKRVADAPACQLLAKLSFFVFTPALTFSKLTQAVSISSIVQLWPLLVRAWGRGCGWPVATEGCRACLQPAALTVAI